MSTSGSRVPVSERTSRRSCTRAPARDERQVGVADGELAGRPVEDGGDGDPRLVARPRTGCARALEPQRHAARSARQPDHPPGDDRVAGEQGDAVGGRAGLLVAGGRHPRAARRARPARRRTGARPRPSPRRRPRSGPRPATGAGRGRPPAARGRRRRGSSRRRPAGRRPPGRRPSERPCRMLKVAMRTSALCPGRGGFYRPRACRRAPRVAGPACSHRTETRSGTS